MLKEQIAWPSECYLGESSILVEDSMLPPSFGPSKCLNTSLSSSSGSTPLWHSHSDRSAPRKRPVLCSGHSTSGSLQGPVWHFRFPAQLAEFWERSSLVQSLYVRTSSRKVRSLTSLIGSLDQPLKEKNRKAASRAALEGHVPRCHHPPARAFALWLLYPLL